MGMKMLTNAHKALSSDEMVADRRFNFIVKHEGPGIIKKRSWLC